MIDASSFANSYNAFWNECAPTCDRLIRRINLGGSNRFEPPLTKSHTVNPAIIAEYAFSLFVAKMSFEEMSNNRSYSINIEDDAWTQTTRRLNPFVSQGLTLDRNFGEEALFEIYSISSSLIKFFKQKSLVLRPIFAGCGYIDRSEGDVIADDTLFEIKTVDRKFRSADIKQLLTYSALNLASNQFTVRNIGLYNPRAGLFYTSDLEEICQEISGKSAQALLTDIISTISSGDISR